MSSDTVQCLQSCWYVQLVLLACWSSVVLLLLIQKVTLDAHWYLGFDHIQDLMLMFSLVTDLSVQ